MDPAVLVLAATSVPVLGHNAYWLYREREVDLYYGVLSGIFTFIGAVLVAYGFPGSLIMPLAFGIIAIGGFHGFIKVKKRGKLVKGILFAALSMGIYLSGVFL